MTNEPTPIPERPATSGLFPANPLDVAIPPGETLRELIEERQLNLARVMVQTGMRPGELERFILGHKPVTPELAKALEVATGTPAWLWLRLQAEYDKQRRTTRPRAEQE